MLPQDQPADKAHAPRLLVDAMLGRLAHWLRLMGYDAAYWRDGSDTELAQEARVQGRLIVTRDRQLAGRRGVHALLLASDQLDEQIAEIRGLLWGNPEPFTRCPECNELLVELNREAARELVPPYVWHTQAAFRRCPACGRVYWKGTHWPGMQAKMKGEQ